MSASVHSSGSNAWWTPRLVWPVAAAAVIRFGLLATALVRTGTSVIASGDTASYLEPGRNLLWHGCFVTGTLPEIDRTPGYPLFLALFSLPGLEIAAFAQVLLSVLSVVLVWRLARAVFGDGPAALIAAWLFSLEPVSVIYSVRLLPETLYLALLLLSLERLAVFFRSRRLSAIAVSGVWLAAATFVRPVSYYLPVALALGVFLFFIKIPGLRWKAPAVLLLCTVPWLAAWQLRNWNETGFTGFSSIVQRNLYFYQAAEATARAESRSFAGVQSDFGYPDERAYLARHPEQAGWSQASRIAYMGSEAGRILRAHPVSFLKMYAEGSAVVAFTPCVADLLRLLDAYPENWPQRVVSEGPLRMALRLIQTHPRLVAAMASLELLLLAFYLFALRGTLRMSPRRPQLGLLLGVALYFLAVSGGAQAVGRYRLPVMPVVCVLAAEGLRRRITFYSGTRVDASRNHSVQIDATTK
jgi:hypothetical protein